jgi:preprotein translocase subunit SecE
VDFLIATESEMKKVTWSSRKEVWGATKVVIGMVIFLAVGLFCVDFAFTWFFWKIGVLKAPF